MRRQRLGKPTVFFPELGYTDHTRGGDAMAAVMLLSFAVNFLLLLGTARLAMEDAPICNLLTASLLASAYAAACLLPGLRFLRGTVFWLGSLVGILVLAFGWNRRTWKKGGIFVLLTMALGGTALAVGRGEDWMLLLYALVVCMVGRIAFGANRRLLPVKISGGGKSVELTALIDTGNELRDPITGERVLVVGAKAAQALTGLSESRLRDPLTTMEAGVLPGLRLIPYQTVGAQTGMMLAMRFPSVKIGGRDRPGIVAFAPRDLDGESYQALAGGFV